MFNGDLASCSQQFEDVVGDQGDALHERVMLEGGIVFEDKSSKVTMHLEGGIGRAIVMQ